MLTNAPLTPEERERLQRPITLTWTWERWGTIGGILDAMTSIHQRSGNREMSAKCSQLADDFSTLYRAALRSEYEDDVRG